MFLFQHVNELLAIHTFTRKQTNLNVNTSKLYSGVNKVQLKPYNIKQYNQICLKLINTSTIQRLR